MRKLSSIAAANMIVAASMAHSSPAMEMLMPRAKHKQRPLWTCKKCQHKFYPNMSNSLCDECINRRDGR